MAENESTPKSGPKPLSVVIGILVLVAVVIVGYFLFRPPEKKPIPPPPPRAEEPARPEDAASSEAEGQVIDYNKVKAEKDSPESSLMEERKKKYGVGDSLDLIVQSDETIKVGPHLVSMREIMEKVAAKKGEVLEEDLLRTGQGSLREFGVYVVQPGDNIWNIHFGVLKDYFKDKGVSLSPRADEPKTDGTSSGVGKILKFSENLVQIYNLDTKSLDTDLNVIEPNGKIVVYSMSEVFELLDHINYGQVDLIQFDGDTLWLPVRNNGSRG